MRVGKIYLSEKAYIEYKRDDNGEVVASSVFVYIEGKTVRELNDEYSRGILACLINSRINNQSSSTDDIIAWAWPPERELNSDYDYGRNVAEKIRKLRKKLTSYIGKDAAMMFLPHKERGFDYAVRFDVSRAIASESDDMVSISSLVEPEDDSGDASRVYFRTADQLIRKGFSSHQIALQLVQNDIELYGFPENTPQEGSSEKWASFITEQPDTWGCLLNEQDRIVGNYSLVILSKEQRSQLMNGNLNDGEIELDDTIAFVEGEDLTLYILNVSINTGYNTLENRKLLINNMFSFIKQLASSHNIYFKEIFYTSWMARSFLASYGFKKIKRIQKNDGSIVMGIEKFPEDICGINSKDLNEIKQIYFARRK